MWHDFVQERRSPCGNFMEIIWNIGLRSNVCEPMCSKLCVVTVTVKLNSWVPFSVTFMGCFFNATVAWSWIFVMVDYMREMTVKKSFKSNKYGSFECLVFLSFIPYQCDEKWDCSPKPLQCLNAVWVFECNSVIQNKCNKTSLAL